MQLESSPHSMRLEKVRSDKDPVQPKKKKKLMNFLKEEILIPSVMTVGGGAFGR